MNFTFNLVERPWIPCVDLKGEYVELSLLDTLTQAHKLQGLGGESPLVTAALSRLLLAVLHRVFGPEDYTIWGEIWSSGAFDSQAVADYLGKWSHRFDLFDSEHPFYQAPDDRVKPKSVNSLVLDLASGNNATLFDHSTDAEETSFTPSQCARIIVTSQAFGLSGLSGISGQSFTDGTCARGVLFLVLGDSLFETLMLNLIQYPTEDDVMVHMPNDCLAWEMDDPSLPDRSIPLGYLDYLTWQNRRILLRPEVSSLGVCVRHMTVAPGLRMDYDVLNRDPMKHYRVDEKSGLKVQRFNEDQVLWRDSVSLFKLQDAQFRPPRTFQWLAGLVYDGIGNLESSQTCRYMALGMATDKRQAAKVDFYRSEQMPLPLTYLVERMLVEKLTDVLRLTSDVQNVLDKSAWILATLLFAPQVNSGEEHKPQDNDLNNLLKHWAVERDYWANLEVPFRQLVVALPGDPDGAMDSWLQTLEKTAWQAFDRLARDIGLANRGLKAEVRARDQLAAGLGKVLREM